MLSEVWNTPSSHYYGCKISKNGQFVFVLNSTDDVIVLDYFKHDRYMLPYKFVSFDVANEIFVGIVDELNVVGSFYPTLFIYDARKMTNHLVKWPFSSRAIHSICACAQGKFVKVFAFLTDSMSFDQFLTFAEVNTDGYTIEAIKSIRCKSNISTTLASSTLTPDGNHVVTTCLFNSHRRFVSFNTLGKTNESTFSPVGCEAYNVFHPTWSPSGNHVAYYISDTVPFLGNIVVAQSFNDQPTSFLGSSNEFTTDLLCWKSDREILYCTPNRIQVQALKLTSNCM